MKYENLRIAEIDDEYIVLENDNKEKLRISSYHCQDCCEEHYLDFSGCEELVEDGMLFCVDTENPGLKILALDCCRQTVILFQFRVMEATMAITVPTYTLP